MVGEQPVGRVMSQDDRTVLIDLVRHGGESLILDDRRSAQMLSQKQIPATTTCPSIRQRFANGLRIQDEGGFSTHVAAEEAGSKRDFVLLPSPTAKMTTFLFSGATTDYFIPPALLTDYDTHLVVMRDPSRRFHLAGLQGLGRNYAECVDSIKRLSKYLDSEQHFCMGVSSGGVGALRFGCDINASGILGFSIPTTLNIDDDPGAELRRYPQLHRLYKTDRKLGIDLKKYYESFQQKPGVMLVYSSGHVRDKWLAERMNGIEGVELIEISATAGHRTYGWIRDENKLRPLFDRFFALIQIDSHGSSKSESSRFERPTLARAQQRSMAGALNSNRMVPTTGQPCLAPAPQG